MNNITLAQFNIVIRSLKKLLIIALLIAFSAHSMEKINHSKWNLEEVLLSNEKFVKCLNTNGLKDPTVVEFRDKYADSLAEKLVDDNESLMQFFPKIPNAIFQSKEFCRSLWRKVRKNNFFIDESSQENNIHDLMFWLIEGLSVKRHVRLTSALLQRLEYFDNDAIVKFFDLEYDWEKEIVPFAFLHAIKKIDDKYSLDLLCNEARHAIKYGLSYELIKKKPMQRIFKRACKSIKKNIKEKEFMGPLFIIPLLTVITESDPELYLELFEEANNFFE